MWATQRMAEGAGLYIADSDNQAMANDVKRALKGNGKVSRSVLLRALGHKYKAKELDGVLNLMIEAEEITIERGAHHSEGRTAAKMVHFANLKEPVLPVKQPNRRSSFR